jgi:hypothetical protein
VPDPRGALELRLERGRAALSLRHAPAAPGLVVRELVLEAPADAAAAAGGGPAAFRHRLCDLGALTLELGPAGLETLRAALAPAAERAGVAELRLALRAGFVELAGRLDGGAPFTARATPIAGRPLRVVVHEPRAYAAAPLPAAALAPRLAAALAGRAGGEATGAVAQLGGAPRALLLRVLPRAGVKLPRIAAAGAEEASVGPDGARVRWDAGDPASPPDAEAAAALEGEAQFGALEERLASGDVEGAREGWRALPPGARAHPFATARALSLLAADPRFHAEARALARAALARLPAFPAALLAEALLARARGDPRAASVAFAALAAASLSRGERFAALAAADACGAEGESAEPEALTVALEAALAADRTHLPALRALAALGERDGAREGGRDRLLRAHRGLAAHAPSAAEKAAAHRRLAELLAATDPAAARLHRDNARRLAPRRGG